MSARSTYSIGCACLVLAIIACAADGDDDAQLTERDAMPTIGLSVEMERGETMSRLVIFIHNDTDTPYIFETGSRGGGGSLDDGFRFEPAADFDRLQADEERWIIGTAPTVVPEFEFAFGDAGSVRFRAPVFGGPTRRALRKHEITVAPNSRVQYASFAVPTRTVTGRFIEARLELPDRTLHATDLLVKRISGQAE